MSHFLAQYWFIFAIWFVIGVCYYLATPGKNSVFYAIVWGIIWPFMFIGKLLAKITN